MKRKKSSHLFIWLVAAYLLLPLALTCVYSLFTEWIDVLPTGFTLRYYAEVLSDRLFWAALARTVVISFVPVIITAFVLLCAMYVAVLYVPSLDKYLQIICTIPYAIQGIILPVSVLSLYSGAPFPLSNRVVMLVLTYCVIILPYMYRGIKNSLAGVDVLRIVEAAEMLGADKFYSFFRIIVPSILSGVVIASMLSVALVFGDFVIVNTIGGNYYSTAQMYLLKKMFISGQLTSAVIIVLFIVTLLISAIIFTLKSKAESSAMEVKK